MILCMRLVSFPDPTLKERKGLVSFGRIFGSRSTIKSMQRLDLMVSMVAFAFDRYAPGSIKVKLESDWPVKLNSLYSYTVSIAMLHSYGKLVM